jgi:hypothetical protein
MSGFFYPRKTTGSAATQISRHGICTVAANCFFLLCFFLLCSFLGAEPGPLRPEAFAQGQPAWKKEKSEDGIEIFSRSRAGSAYNEVRGVAEYDAPPETLLPLFRDADGYRGWLAECKRSGAVGVRQGPNDFFLYAVIGIPWPFEDRDTVVKAKIRRLPEGKGYVVFLRSMNDELAPPRNGLVRMKSLEGRWLLESLPSGKTRAEFRIFLEPAGSLTSAFVNGTAASIQLKTLKNVREKLTKLERGGPLDVPELGPLDPAMDP